MLKKCISVLLVIAMLSVLLAGCSTKTEQTAAESEAPTESEIVESSVPEGTQAPEPAEPAQSEEAAESKTPVSEEPAVREISYPLCEETETFTFWKVWPPFLQGQAAPGDSPLFDEILKRLNVNFEFNVVSTEASSVSFNLMCASGEYLEILESGAGNYSSGGMTAIEDEVLLDLKPLIEEYAPHIQALIDNDENVRRAYTNDDGTIASITDIYMKPYYMDQGFWIRGDWLEKLNMEVPETIEEAETVFRAFRDELGATDPVIVVNGGTGGGKLQLIANTWGPTDWYPDEDGQIRFGGIEDSYKQFLTKMREWFNEGIINQDFISYTDSFMKPPSDIVYNDLGGCFNEDITSIPQYLGNATNPEFKLVAQPSLRPSDDVYLETGTVASMLGNYTVSISTSCHDTKVALETFDYFFTDEGALLMNYGTEGSTFYYDESGEAQFTDLIVNNDKFAFQQASMIYIDPGLPRYRDLAAVEKTYTPEQKSAVEVWLSPYVSADKSMPQVSMTADEASQVVTLMTDMNTYINECRLKFITGAMDVEADWDSYVETIKSMNLDKIMEIDQTAYDRYMAK